LASLLGSSSLVWPILSTAEQSFVIEEVIVTARKRAESLQNVPISIQALDATKLEQLGVASFDDYVAMLPSLTVSSQGPGKSEVYMRGAADGGDGNVSGSQPSVGIYLDEQPVTAIGSNLDLHVYDIERIETLAGPQGTLYGASSQAGTLRFITNKPDGSEFSAASNIDVSLTKGGDPSHILEGYVNVPLGDRAALRVSAWDKDDGGYIDNVAGLRTLPLTNFRDITLDNSDLVEENFNELSKQGARAALRVDLDDQWIATLGLIAQKQETRGTWDHDPNDVDDLQIQRFHPDSSSDEFVQASLTLEGEVGEHALTYAVSALNRDVEYEADYTEYSEVASWVPYYACDYSSLAGSVNTDCISTAEHYTDDNTYKRQTHEIRLQSMGAERLNYVLGIFYDDSEHEYLQEFVQPGMTQAYWARAKDGIYYTTDQVRNEQQSAVFGELSFALSEDFEATLGVRRFWSESRLSGFTGFGDSPWGLFGQFPVDASQKESDTIFKANVSWEIDDERLLYFTVSEGYRSGGLNRDPNAGGGSYVPDLLTNYELGWKTTWQDGRLRLNGAAYFMDWQDMQFTVYDFAISTVGNTYNIGAAEIKGLEADVRYLISPDWSVSASLSYNDGQTTAGFIIPGLDAATVEEGTRLPSVPRYKGNLVSRYEFILGGFDAFTQLSYSYHGDAFSEIRPNSRILQEAYQLINLRAGVEFERWGVDVYIHNASDERADVSAGARNSYEDSITTNRPRVMGVKFKLRF
jgi:outer membrane receptor protein involved in Fe transport